jgi:hypothetical protein
MKVICFVVFLATLPVIAAGLVLGADLTAGGAKKDRQEPSPGVCPQTTYLNCMPVVPKERREMCTKEYLEWIKENCPGVRVVR